MRSSPWRSRSDHSFALATASPRVGQAGLPDRRDDGPQKHDATPPRRWRRALAHGVRRGIAMATSAALLIGPTPLGMLTSRPVAAAPISFDGTTTYTQNFQSFSTTTGNSSITLQQMAEVSTLTGGSAISGWYTYLSGGSTGVRWFSADGGSSSTGGFRSMYSSSDGNLALGSQGSGNVIGF
ncbi:MAG: hypothetical protein ACOYK7_10035, partial [Pirellulales bacterium]